MAYSSFTVQQLTERYALTARRATFVPVDCPPQAPSDDLARLIAENQRFPLYSEKARSEFYVAPLLRELWRLFGGRFAFFSGENLDFSAEEGLDGECDFVLCAKADAVVVEAPVVCILEAKRENFERGRDQCAAQLVAAHRLNARTEFSPPMLYGCVTTGTQWQFLRLLNGNLLEIDPAPLFIDDLQRLLGVWVWVLAHYFAPE